MGELTRDDAALGEFLRRAWEHSGELDDDISRIVAPANEVFC